LRLLRSQDYHDDFDAIMERIALQSAAGAKRLAMEIESQVRNLQDFPLSGRTGRLAGTRELVIVRTPYIVIYSSNGIVVLLRILHGAQKWPPSGSNPLK
jgi:toxin ParE1/3/4